MSLKNIPILITGGGGCIGAFVIRGLLEMGARPVVIDLTEDRSRLNLISKNNKPGELVWKQGDITNYNDLKSIFKKYKIEGIIHLAALQVPFAKANPLLGTKVNILGAINILEAAREFDIKRLSYASSIASPAMFENNKWLPTLYGAHKLCGEQMAKVYWQDWQVPSIGIRPAIIYGVGRDQGMTAAPSIAMLAAVANASYVIPFTGNVSFIYVQDAANCFIKAVYKETNGSPVFDMNGHQYNIKSLIADVKEYYPNANISARGNPLPFPAQSDENLLINYLNLPAYQTMQEGIGQTLNQFEEAQKRGVLTKKLIYKIINNNQ